MNSNYKKEINKSDILPDTTKYRKLLGRLLYVSVISRPDISANVNILAQRVNKPTQQDWNELKRIVRYLKDTVNFKLKLGNARADTPIIGYADANWAECR